MFIRDLLFHISYAFVQTQLSQPDTILTVSIAHLKSPECHITYSCWKYMETHSHNKDADVVIWTD